MSESATFNIDITLGTEVGELPNDADVERMIADQMSYDPLDDDTQLAMHTVTLNKRYVDGEDVMVSYNDIKEALRLILDRYQAGVSLMFPSGVLEELDDAVINNATE